MKPATNLRDGHWSDEELVHLLYGLDPSSEKSASHLENCSACSERWQSLQRRKAALQSAPAVSDERLRLQRRAIFDRIEKSSQRNWRVTWMPAAATALLLTVGITMNFHTTPVAAPVVATHQAADQEFMADVASMSDVAASLSDDSPRAAEPIRALFDLDNQAEAR